MQLKAGTVSDQHPSLTLRWQESHEDATQLQWLTVDFQGEPKSPVTLVTIVSRHVSVLDSWIAHSSNRHR